MRPARGGRRLPVMRLLAAAALTLPLAGCGITHLQDLNFRVDNRLHFIAPKDRSKVREPFSISWRVSGFRVASAGSEPPSRDAGYFAIFVDREPIHPGQTMKALARDRFCKRDPKCPSVTDLNNMGVFTTTATSMRFDQIANVRNDTDRVQVHTFVIVLMDTAGHRIGESAWELDLRIPKAGT